MKVRTGFVSNSSSSCYIIALDPDFELRDEMFTEKYWEKATEKLKIEATEKGWGYEGSGYITEMLEDNTPEDIKKYCQPYLNKLKNKGSLWQEEDYNTYSILNDLFEIEGAAIFIDSIDIGPDAQQTCNIVPQIKKDWDKEDIQQFADLLNRLVGEKNES